MAKILITGASSGIGVALYNTFDFNHSVTGLSRRGPDLFIDLDNEDLDLTGVFDGMEFDAVINCAGIMPLHEERRQREIFNVNFWGTLKVIEGVLPRMREGGCIINIASVSGMIADAELPIYAASKAAVISLSKSLAKKLAPKIRVNCISPGFYETNLVPGPTPQELIDTIPMKYEESPYQLFEIVKAILNTKYMTGANIVIDGGVSL